MTGYLLKISPILLLYTASTKEGASVFRFMMLVDDEFSLFTFWESCLLKNASSCGVNKELANDSETKKVVRKSINDERERRMDNSYIVKMITRFLHSGAR